MSSLDENLNRLILVNPVCGRGPRTIESILKLLFSIWKKIDFQGFLGIDVSQEGEGRLKETSKGHFSRKNLICESSLIKTGLCATKKLKGDVDMPD